MAGRTLWGKTESEIRGIYVPQGMELFDYHRRPRVIPSNSPVLETTTTMEKSDLNIDLSCPICMGILQDTMTVKQCLHRFCAACIEKCVRIGKKECPTCRTHISSRRALRPDPIFDAMVRRLFGQQLQSFEEKKDALIEQLNKHHERLPFERKQVQAEASQAKKKTLEEFTEESPREVQGVSENTQFFSQPPFGFPSSSQSMKRKVALQLKNASENVPSDLFSPVERQVLMLGSVRLVDISRYILGSSKKYYQKCERMDYCDMLESFQTERITFSLSSGLEGNELSLDMDSLALYDNFSDGVSPLTIYFCFSHALPVLKRVREEEPIENDLE